jgi:AcrR family transcriptional regulator
MRTPIVAERPATYHRYLDAAEQAFITLGYEGASIRRISADAQAPLGTLHHYWGTKQVLFKHVCERRFAPIQAEQLRRLRLCQIHPLQLRQVVMALVEPPLQAGSGAAGEAATIRLLYGRALTEPSTVVQALVAELFGEASQVFLSLVRQCCPQLDATQFYWRFSCALGAFIFAQSFGDRLAWVTGEPPPALAAGALADEIATFIVRGMVGTDLLD